MVTRQRAQHTKALKSKCLSHSLAPSQERERDSLESRLSTYYKHINTAHNELTVWPAMRTAERRDLQKRFMVVERHYKINNNNVDSFDF